MRITSTPTPGEGDGVGDGGEEDEESEEEDEDEEESEDAMPSQRSQSSDTPGMSPCSISSCICADISLTTSPTVATPKFSEVMTV